jgi:hypothetical protein
MKRGHLIFSQNSDIDYVRQAYTLALTIKKHNVINNVTLVTNNIIPEKFKQVFDYIVSIPWSDDSSDSSWKIENRWKLIHSSPYDETMVYDSDMLLLNSNDSWWNELNSYDIFLTSKVLDYRNNIIQDTLLRKTFIENNLPNIYFGFHYFKKTTRAYEFYKWLEIIVKNYKEFYETLAPNHTQNFCSMDVSAAIATKILNAEDEFTAKQSSITFVHMKKELQNWSLIPPSWTSCLPTNFTTDFKFYLANNLQNGLFHYTEDEFLTDKILKVLES